MLLRYKIQLAIAAIAFLLPVSVVVAGNIVPGNTTARFYDTGSRINLGLVQGDVTVSDDAVTGYAWAEDWGWINFAPTGYGIENDGDGNLSGFAWGENLGWINFNPNLGGVSIDEDGFFSGFAWAENGGWIQFDCATAGACVQTTWQPEGGGTDPEEPEEPGTPPSGGGGSSPRPPEDGDTEDETGSEAEEPNEPPTTPTDPVEPTEPPGETPTDPTPPEERGDTEPVVSDEGETDRTEEGGDDVDEGSDEPEEEGGDESLVVPGVIAPDEPLREHSGGFSFAPIISFITDPVVATTAAALGIAVGLGSVTASAFLGLGSISELVFLPQKLWYLFLALFGFRRKRLPWGTVYDSVTKQPLDPAYVQLLESASRKEAEGVITDLDGRFGFLPEVGNYTIQARKTNYTFPSARLQGREADVLYDNLYFGGDIAIQSNDEAIIRNIPLDPVGADWNEAQKQQNGFFNFYSKHDVLIYSISTLLFYLGFALSVVMIFVYPSLWHGVVAAIYAVLVIFRAITTAPQRLGSIRYKNGKPMAYGLVRVFLAEGDSEVKKIVANKYGKFYCLVTPANYYLKVFARVDEEEYREVYTSPVFYAKNGLVDGKYIIPSTGL